MLELSVEPQLGFKHPETGRWHSKWQERPEQTWGLGEHNLEDQVLSHSCSSTLCIALSTCCLKK